jgi:hypothetical protein
VTAAAHGARVLRVGHVPIVLRSAQPEVLHRADRYLTGFWTPAPDARGVTVEAVVDRRERRRLTRIAAARGQPAALYMGAPGWTADDGTLLIAGSEAHRVAFVRTRGDPRVLVAADDDEAAATGLVRVARSVVGACLEHGGWAQVHASAVRSPDGSAVLAFGPKGAGKTAVALQLARVGWGLVANDRAWVSAGACRVLPWPSSANVGLGLLAALGWLPQLRARRAAGRPPGYHERPEVTVAIREGRSTPVRDHTGRELKCQLFPSELAGDFAVRLEDGGPVTALLLPSVDLGTDSPEIRPAPVGRLGAADLFPPVSGPDHFPDFLALHRPATARHAAGGAVLEALADRVPAFEIRLGRDPAANAEALSEVCAGPVRAGPDRCPR